MNKKWTDQPMMFSIASHHVTSHHDIECIESIATTATHNLWNQQETKIVYFLR